MVASQVPAESGPLTTQPTERPGFSPDRLRIASPAIQGLVALVVYLVVWVVIARAYPLLAHPGRAQVDQLSMDPNMFTWILRWWPYAIGHGLNPLHTAEAGASSGEVLAWVTMIPSLAVLTAPLTLAAGPVAAFNILVVASVPLSACAAFVLCRRLTGQFWPALVGGAVFGFSAYELNHITAGQLDLAYSLLIPIMAYLVVVWWERGRPVRFTALLALALVLQFYLSDETFAEMTGVWVIALAVGYAFAGQPYRKKVAQLCGLTGIAYLITVVCAAPFLVYALANRPTTGFGQTPAETSIDLAGLVVPRPNQTFGWHWLAHAATPLSIAGRDGYVGVPLLLLVVAFALTSWARRITRFLIVMIVLLIVGALGPVLHGGGSEFYQLPWSALWKLPFIHSAYPARLMVFAFLAMAVMIAFWLARPSQGSWSRWLLALLAVAAIGANTPAMPLASQPGSPAFIATTEYQHHLTPGGRVVVISARGNAGLLWQAETDFYPRLAGGYLGSLLAHRTDLPSPIADLAGARWTPQRVAQFRSYLAAAKVTAILVDAHWAGHWPKILDGLGLRGRLIGGVIVYRVTS
jgi:hypothetical protein